MPTVPGPPRRAKGGRPEWPPVTPAAPCPACSKADRCKLSPDGRRVMCWRTPSAKPVKGGEAWYHDFDAPAPPAARRARPPRATRDFPAMATGYAAALTAADRGRLAAALGLPEVALAALPLVGFDARHPAGPSYTFPETDAAGKVIGIGLRFADPAAGKMAVGGSKRGLTAPTGWRDRPGPLFVPEGASDVLALTHAGLACVGRPSARGGVDHLTRLLADWPADREVVVLGENDRKDDGRWPGRDGAIVVTRRLAAALPGRCVRAALPPPDLKDARAWLTAAARGETPWSDRGSEFAAGLTAADAEPCGDESPPVDPSGSAPVELRNDGPDNPHRLARLYLNETYPGGPPYPLRFWRGEFHGWQDGAYRPVPDADLRGELTQCVDAEFARVNAADLAAWAAAGDDKKKPPEVRKVTVGLVGNVLQALRGMCLLPGAVEPPAWIDGATGPDPAGVLSLRNGLLDLPAAAAGRAGCLLPPDVAFFTLTAAPFDYDPAAPPPAAWLDFLASVWPADPASIMCLQTVFGYLLTPDTGQQKIFLFVGPPRAGKGTVARVLRELLGPANVSGPTLSSLATNFGLAPLLGKTLAVVSDARLGGRADLPVIVERLLSISGEDALTVDRKNREAVTAKLSARFVILSNELPRLGDASGALPSRFVVFRFDRSFLGHEDLTLTGRLLSELPGILNWAVAGWQHLRLARRFVQPADGVELVEEMEDLSSPAGAFVRDRCRVGFGCEVAVADVYAVWRGWCSEHGRREPGTEETFGRDLRAAVPSLRKFRARDGQRRKAMYAGVALRRADDPPDDDGPAGHRGHRDPPSPTGPVDGDTCCADSHSVPPSPGHGDHGARTGGEAHPKRPRFVSDDRPDALRGDAL